MSTIRAPWRALGLLAIAAIALAACTGGASTAPSAAASVAASAAASAAASVAASPSAAASAEASAAASESSDEYEIKVATGAVGTYLTGEDGKTLYTFKPDEAATGKSVCNGDCATKWPPFTVDEGENATAGDGVTASKIGTVKRDDGKTQVTYGGKPVYYYANDTKAGDTNGQGVGGIWFVVAP